MKKITTTLLTLLAIEGFSQATTDSARLDTPKYRELIQTIKNKIESYNKLDRDFKIDELTYVSGFENKELSRVDIVLNDKEIYIFFVDSKTYEIMEVIDLR